MFNFIIKLVDSIVWPLVITIAIWIVFFLNMTTVVNLNSFGMHPWDVRGVLGIFTMPFLHANFDHLFSNSVPLVLLMGFIFIYFKKDSSKILALNMLSTGFILLFLGQEGTTHIGASGLVYAFIFFLITHAFLSKNKEMLAAAFILIFLYGSLIYGLFPEYGRLIGKNISWEGHLAGAISGVIWGYLFRNTGPQQKTFFHDEDELDDDDEIGYWSIPPEENEPPQPKVTIHYHFKEKPSDNDFQG
ncbi:MAG: rhomboid family intramembrane serine protease [Bacteroidia bacterium]